MNESECRVRVLVAGVYNGPGHRALPWAGVGSLIEVADAEYAERLVVGGLVTREIEARRVEPPGPTENQAQGRPMERKRRRG